MIGRSLNIKFGKLKIGVTKKKWIFPNLIFQLHPIITQLILNQFACSLPKTNTTFHQLFKYVKKEEIFSSIRGENCRNIFGPCSTRGTVYLVKCLSKPYLKHFFDCKMFIAATSFNPPGTIFKQGSDKWQKITWIKYWIIPKRNYFQVACSILIIDLPKVSLIPNFHFL